VVAAISCAKCSFQPCGVSLATSVFTADAQQDVAEVGLRVDADGARRLQQAREAAAVFPPHSVWKKNQVVDTADSEVAQCALGEVVVLLSICKAAVVDARIECLPLID